MKYERLVEIFDDYKRYFKNLDGVNNFFLNFQ